MKNWKKMAILACLSLSVGVLHAGTTTSTTSTTKKSYSIDFDSSKYTVKTLTINGVTINYRAYEQIVYVKNPIDTKYETMNFFVPEAYFNGESVNGYNNYDAPIFFPNQVGGYMPAEADSPGTSRDGVNPNAIFVALSKGYVVASPGARGRVTKDSNGLYTGKAPAAIVDLKAAVRYLHYNDKVMPGSANRIVSNGTSAGGALSSLLGASGNNKDYDKYLKEIGAANASDAVLVVSAYCPITNLENADMAYEWLFNGINEYKSLKITQSTDFKVERTYVTGSMTEDQIKASNELKAMFPKYLNSLKLKDKKGNVLSLDSDGNGNFKDFVKSYIIASAQKAMDKGTDLSQLTWITINDNKVIDVDMNAYVSNMGRLKTTSAFDKFDLSSGENSLFGTSTIDTQHFTAYGQKNSTGSATMSDPKIIKMMNAMNYIGAKNTTTARYWRIRHGSIDSDTALAVPTIMATKLQNLGYVVDFAIPWGVPHSGDYDLEELFEWTDTIFKSMSLI